MKYVKFFGMVAASYVALKWVLHLTDLDQSKMFPPTGA